MPSAQLPRRRFGRHADELSVIGFGGVMISGMPPDQVERLVAWGVERGVNYFDVAPTYGDAEERLGPALRPYRDRAFLACKTTARDRAGAEADLARSLERLQTDHLDLYQLHAINDVARDVDAAFARGGAMEAFTAAQREGRVRYLGFSAHAIEAASAAMERYEFDSMLLPVNFATWHVGGFGPQAMRQAQQRGVARLSIKALATSRWETDDPAKGEYPQCWYRPLSDPRQAELALRWTLGQDVTATLPPGHEGLWRLCVELALAPQALRPLAPAEEQELRLLAQQITPLFRAG